MSTKLVGPVVRDGEIAEALITAIERDNPDAQVYVDDRGGYIRIHTEKYCRVTRQSLEAALGRSCPLSQIEPALATFAGRIQSGDQEIVWYLEN
ncbi:Toluene-4-monooxygenase system protein D [Scytonema sp. HK-05]|uniref:MmoB/DmpM family protein n=1 Tax=Scytonema sp. HK-05 TaxID=1137095 RepID=UPI000936E431|nr:MmoB/DmpM family protein [Scytonema sp. HK-05]OKH57598.1 monooxygenase [Scytonema sp. HK-05]BAY44584.1 Toluene-4-monooxygenase system protein D [Scytonema sp. HK-05]